MIQQNITIFRGRLYYTWKLKDVKAATVLYSATRSSSKLHFSSFTGCVNFRLKPGDLFQYIKMIPHLVPAKWDHINRALESVCKQNKQNNVLVCYVHKQLGTLKHNCVLLRPDISKRKLILLFNRELCLSAN